MPMSMGDGSEFEAEDDRAESDPDPDSGFGFALSKSELDDRLVLRDLGHPERHPLAVDFLSTRLTYRRQHGLGKGQLLARALGLRSRPIQRAADHSHNVSANANANTNTNSSGAMFVLDATAGLGVDAFVIASLGCRVRAIERSPVIFALLEDGYRRLVEAEASDTSRDTEELRAITARLSFERGDARDVIEALREDERPDVIYLDPMYPETGRSKSALPKKGMQIFRRLIGDEDNDAAAVLEAALAKARDRVVVKRPLKAPFLGGIKPAHVFTGKTARYDMLKPGT